MLLMLTRSALDLLQSSLRWIIQLLKNTLWKLFIVLFILIFTLCLSAFFYSTFYYTLMPVAIVSKPVYFHFSICKSNSAVCSFPSANVSFQRNEFFLKGQKYRIYLQLELPESQVNEQIGMFMVTVQLYNRNLQPISASSRAAMLRYRSPLLRTLHTLAFSVLLLSGLEEQKQTLNIELFSRYTDDALNPSVGSYIELQNKLIQFYCAHLNIHAYFTGIRYAMFHWPVLSAFIGTCFNFALLMVLAFLSWYRYSLRTEQRQLMAGDEVKLLTLEERRHIVRAAIEKDKKGPNRSSDGCEPMRPRRRMKNYRTMRYYRL